MKPSRVADLTAAAVALAVAGLAAAYQSHAARPELAKAPAGAAQSPSPKSEVPELLRKHAMAAFVVPLMDDDEPPRFADVYRALLCAEYSNVSVNGQPVVAGDLVPPGSFALQWDLQMYCPFGVGGPVLNGHVEVLVFRDDEQGMSAVLRPGDLRVLPSALAVDAARDPGTVAPVARETVRAVADR